MPSSIFSIFLSSSVDWLAPPAKLIPLAASFSRILRLSGSFSALKSPRICRIMSSYLPPGPKSPPRPSKPGMPEPFGFLYFLSGYFSQYLLASRILAGAPRRPQRAVAASYLRITPSLYALALSASLDRPL